jgi:N-acetylglutamate synthase-like GNAT family acetyltransferase
MTATDAVTIRRASPADLPRVRSLVDAAGLSSNGLEDAAVFVAEDDGGIVGTVALERHGTGADTAFLLRSAAVDPAARNRGAGEALVHAALRHVDALRAPVGLLTETADGYFTRFGFAPINREDLPASLQASSQLQGACPDSAHALLRPATAGGEQAGDRTPVTGPSVWRAADLADPTEWTVQLTDGQRAEIVTEATAAARAGRTVATLTRDDLPLASLQPIVRATVTALHAGRGFVLLRGFPIEEMDGAAVELAYAGLGLHLGIPVGQDAKGSLLGHVRDERVPRTGPHIRLYQTHERQDFHTDGADIVGLLCLHRAVSGGESRVASTHAVYNHILDVRPDLLEVLYQPFAWDRNDEQPPGDPPYFLLPAIHDLDGTPRVFFIGWYIRDAQRHADAPRLTPAQIEAMELVEETANDPAFHVEMDFRPGDIQLIANWNILHAREAYQDADDPAERRHLLRLWLKAHDFTGAVGLLRDGIP